MLDGEDIFYWLFLKVLLKNEKVYFLYKSEYHVIPELSSRGSNQVRTELYQQACENGAIDGFHSDS